MNSETKDPYETVLAAWLGSSSMNHVDDVSGFTTLLELVTHCTMKENVEPFVLELLLYILRDGQYSRQFYLVRQPAEEDDDQDQLVPYMQTKLAMALRRLNCSDELLDQLDEARNETLPQLQHPFNYMRLFLKGISATTVQDSIGFDMSTLIVFAEQVEWSDRSPFDLEEFDDALVGAKAYRDRLYHLEAS